MNKVLESNSGCKGQEVVLKKDFWGNFTKIKIKGFIKATTFYLDTCTVEPVDADSTKEFVGSAAAGLGGALLLGPIGMFAGILAGGNKRTGIFVIRQGDDAHVIQITDKAWITALQARAALK